MAENSTFITISFTLVFFTIFQIPSKKLVVIDTKHFYSFSNTWQEIAPLLRAVCWCAVASCNGKLYVIGSGTDEDQTVKVSYCYFFPKK